MSLGHLFLRQWAYIIWLSCEHNNILLKSPKAKAVRPIFNCSNHFKKCYRKGVTQKCAGLTDFYPHFSQKMRFCPKSVRRGLLSPKIPLKCPKNEAFYPSSPQGKLLKLNTSTTCSFKPHTLTTCEFAGPRRPRRPLGRQPRAGTPPLRDQKVSIFVLRNLLNWPVSDPESGQSIPKTTRIPPPWRRPQGCL